MDVIVVGTCGACGGAVVMPRIWSGVGPVPRTCNACGRHASHGPVIPMQDAPTRAPLPYTVRWVAGGRYQ